MKTRDDMIKKYSLTLLLTVVVSVAATPVRSE